jgi:hypothetical protein
MNKSKDYFIEEKFSRQKISAYALHLAPQKPSICKIFEFSQVSRDVNIRYWVTTEMALFTRSLFTTLFL